MSSISTLLPGVPTATTLVPPLQPPQAFATGQTAAGQPAPVKPSAQVIAEGNAVSAAAHKYGVDFQVLWGIFGAESTWGKGGSNWFGLVAVPRTGTFAGDADQAAKTLAGLLKQNGGDYDKALKAYSGGAYDRSHLATLWTTPANPLHGTIASLSKLLKEVSKGEGNPITAIGDAVSGAANAITSPLDAVGKFLGALMDPHTWLLIAEVIGGAALVFAALHELTGGATTQAASVPAAAARMVAR